MIDQYLEECLAKCQVTEKEFSELLVRLLDWGVICRDESQVEELLYDRFLRCEALVESWLAPLGVRLQHDRRFQFIRIYPPAATVPGMPDAEQPHHGGFRTRLSQAEVAAILVLRVEYEKGLREGQVDEQGCVPAPLEALELGLRNLLKMSLPETQGERVALLRKLRQLRLIQFSAEDGSSESWLRIRPTITHFVNDAAIAEVMELAGVATTAEQQADTSSTDETGTGDLSGAEPDVSSDADEQDSVVIEGQSLFDNEAEETTDVS